MEDAFKHFDKDGCGFITREGFSTGLEEMGVFQEFSEKEVEKVSLAWTSATEMVRHLIPSVDLVQYVPDSKKPYPVHNQNLLIEVHHERDHEPCR